MSSTHPICADVANSCEADELFDGISYGKGSAWLKQLYFIIGHDTMSKGLTMYFKKYEWQNTTLPDFVGCFDEAYRASGDKSLGADFDLVAWSDTWLNTSGVNTLEPILELADGKLKSLKIKQGMGLKGKNRLRTQKLNVALYRAGQDSEPIIIREVVVGEKEELTTVDISSLPADFQFGAVNVNEGEHAYAKVRFDPQSIKWFTENLYTVKDALTRAAIGRYFWMLVMDKQMTSL